MRLLLFFLTINPEKIEIHGSKGIFYEYRDFSGNYPEGFYPYSLRQEYLKMNIKGILRYSTEVNGEIMQNSNPLKEDHIFLNLKNPYFTLNLGDHSVFFEENSLLLEKTYNQGASGKIFYKYTEGGFIYTKAKGKNLYKRFRGDNTQGPFYLDYAPLIQESERVRMIKNGRYENLKRGIDYEIDYFSGSITFLNRIIKKDEIIEIFYQARDENINEIYGFRAGVKYIGYSEVNLRNKISKQGVYGIDFNLPFKYFNLRFESAFDKYNSRKIGAYGTNGSVDYKELKIKGYYKKFNDFYRPIEGLYFERGGKEDSISGEYKWFYFKRYDFEDITRKEINYSFGLKFRKFGYEFSENYLKEDKKFISSMSSFYLLQEIKKLRFQIDYAFGKEKNPEIFEGKRSAHIIRSDIKYRRETLNISSTSNYKIAGNYKEYNQKSNITLSFKKASLYLNSEYFKNSQNPSLFIISSGYIFYPFDFFKTNGFLKREHKFLSDSLGKGTMLTLLNSFDLKFKNNSLSPFINFREIKGDRYYFNYISKGFNISLFPYRDLSAIYLTSDGRSKSSKDKKNNLIISKNFKDFLLVYEYLYFLNKGRTYFDTLSSNVQRTKANRFSLNFMGNGKSMENIFKISDSLLIRENQRVSYNTWTLKSRFSKDIKPWISVYTGMGMNRKKGFDTYISNEKIKFYTISPFTGIIGRYKNYLTIEGNFEIENSLKRNIDYGKKDADLNFSFNYEKVSLSAGLNYKKFLSPSYEDLRFTFNGEFRF